MKLNRIYVNKNNIKHKYFKKKNIRLIKKV